MNEEYIKEYEEMSLCDFADELVEPLSTIKQDLTKTIYIHYAKERDENEDLRKQNKELKDNWNKLKEWLVQLQKFKGINQQGFSWGVAQEVLDKMQEIEGGMNEGN